MRRLSKKAFATLACCEKTKRYFGITVDETLPGTPGFYSFVWSFKIDKDKAMREGYDSNKVTGSIILDGGYPGCPYCESKDFVVCGRCGKVICWHGQSSGTCPHCGCTSRVATADTLDITGGGF